jgi:hypothetical protein
VKKNLLIPILPWVVFLPLFLSFAVEGLGFNRIGGVSNNLWILTIPVSFIFCFIFLSYKIKLIHFQTQHINLNQSFIYFFIYFLFSFFLKLFNNQGIDYSAIKVIILMTSFLFFLDAFTRYFFYNLASTSHKDSLENRYILIPITIIGLVILINSSIVGFLTEGTENHYNFFLSDKIIIYNFEQYFAFIFVLGVASATRLNLLYFLMLYVLFMHLTLMSNNHTATLLEILLLVYFVVDKYILKRSSEIVFKVNKVFMVLTPIIYLLIMNFANLSLNDNMSSRQFYIQNYFENIEWYKFILPLSGGPRGLTSDMHNEFLEVFNAVSLLGFIAFYSLVIKKVFAINKLYKMQCTSLLLVIFIAGMTVENLLHPYLLVITSYTIAFYCYLTAYSK